MSEARQRVIVTGAGRSIGRAIAERFHRAGAAVHMCCATEASRAETLAANPGMTGMVADVGDAAAVEAFMTQGLEALGGLDVLVNNAGISGPVAPPEEVALADWDRTMQVNVNGMFYCTRLAVPALKANGAAGGSIINISTASTRTGMMRRTAYITSKAAVDGMTQNLARELGPDNIRCNAILPGIIDNPRGRRLVERLAAERGQTFEEAERDYFSYVSLRSWIDVDEVADTAYFLASDGARRITGQCIGVCGGLEWEQ